MFEKEAIRHAFEDTIGVECLNKPVEDFTYEELSDELQEKAYDFQQGAEFGYNKAKEELKDAYKESVETQNEFIIKLQKELEEERKLNAEIKARFVKCNTCTDEMKSKCLMFTENLCEGERCEELIDIVSLVNKSDLERKIEALEKANEWHYVKDGDLPKAYQECYFIYSNVYGEDNKVIFSKSSINVLTGVYAFVIDEESDEETTEPCFYDDINDDEIDLSEVYAWKEIVLPELPKGSE